VSIITVFPPGSSDSNVIPPFHSVVVFLNISK
jgi:hypothetical protein